MDRERAWMEALDREKVLKERIRELELLIIRMAEVLTIAVENTHKTAYKRGAQDERGAIQEVPAQDVQANPGTTGGG